MLQYFSFLLERYHSVLIHTVRDPVMNAMSMVIGPQ